MFDVSKRRLRHGASLATLLRGKQVVRRKLSAIARHEALATMVPGARCFDSDGGRFAANKHACVVRVE